MAEDIDQKLRKLKLKVLIPDEYGGGTLSYEAKLSKSAIAQVNEVYNAYTTSKIILELEKFDAMKPETGAYLSDMIADRIAELRKTL